DGVGIDLLDIARLERALGRRPALASRLFTSTELDYARARRRPARHLAARFAAKEATVKALGLGAMRPHDIEVVSGERPELGLSGEAAERAREGGVELSVSLTHSDELAAAVVLARSGARPSDH